MLSLRPAPSTDTRQDSPPEAAAASSGPQPGSGKRAPAPGGSYLSLLGTRGRGEGRAR